MFFSFNLCVLFEGPKLLLFTFLCKSVSSVRKKYVYLLDCIICYRLSLQ